LRRLLKILRIVPRVLYALVAGIAIRLARRVLRRQPRIWHGISPEAFTKTHVMADRLGGFPSRSVMRHSRLRDYAIVRDADFDVVYEARGNRPDETHWLCYADLLRNADIWYGHFDSHFFRWDQSAMNDAAVRVARLAGIRIIIAPHGADIMHRHRYVSRYDWVGRAQLDYPQWDLEAQKAIVAQRLALFCRHADIVIGGDSSLVRMLPRRDLYFPSVAMDIDALVPAPPVSRAVPRIIHAPNHRNVKGSEYLFAAVDELNAHGIACELVLIERIPRHEALQRYADADIVADQFIIGAWGVLALEAMALGKPVLTYLAEEQLGDPVYNHPVVNTPPDRIAAILAPLILIPELRRRLGEAGRASVERHHSVAAFSALWSRIYEHVWFGRALDLEHTAMFDPARKPRSYSTDPASEEFWPVPVGDLIDRIRDAVQRTGR
jgi:glycosyltransferase involved in cell wall biosynthesis